MNLDHLLKPEHLSAGMHLEDDEDWVYLSQGDEGIQLFRPRVTLGQILNTADRYISAAPSSKMSWRMKNTCNA